MKRKLKLYAPKKEDSLLSFLETSSLIRLKNPEIKQSYNINFLKFDKEGMYIVRVVSLSNKIVYDCTDQMKIKYGGHLEEASYVVFGCVVNNCLEAVSLRKVEFAELCMWILD